MTASPLRDLPEAFHEEAWTESIHLLNELAGADGFLASSHQKANYRRIWGRDGAIIGLAALVSRDDTLIDALRRTLVTLARHQGPHGEIPSNVDTTTGRISYGGTAGRIDADLWFVITAGQFHRRTQDGAFLDEMLPVL